MPCNIFYTDDDHDDQVIFLDAINEISDDVNVTMLHNGTDLMLSLRNPPPSPHMIFLDLNMPVKNGYEILKEIMDMGSHKNFPVIIFTTSSHISAIETTRNLGASLYITKPSSYHVLKNILKHVLSIDWQTFIPSKNDFVYKAN